MTLSCIENFRSGARKAARALPPLLALLASLPALCGAVIPQTINYQGFLLSKVTSLPLEVPQDINFVIYPAAAGGSALFTEGRCKVPVTKGRYDVEIGSVSGGIPASVFLDNQNLWLEIQVDPDRNCTGTYEAMTPRIRLQATPFAFNALYASTASSASPFFTADIIGALPQTTHGAVTISTNLFVQGGISVGNISPGQKLSVAGVVESQGVWPDCAANPANYTCGFRFPDGSIQVKASANTIWDVSGPNIYSINEGNVSIGENNTSPLARLHISTAAGDAGDILLVSTGTSKMFRVNGLGQVYGGSYYGDGSTLSNIVRKGGDTMTGPLTLAASSLTITSPLGLNTPKIKLADNVEISSASINNFGGVFISTHVRLVPGAIIYGNGSGLSNVATLDNTKVSTTGDTMSGQLTLGFNPVTLSGSTLTVTGSAFSVGGSTLAVANGNVAVGAQTYLARFTVNGGMTATSSVTAQGGMYTTTLNSTQLADLQNVRASTGTFWGYAGPNDASSYSVMTSSGILVQKGKVVVQGGGGFVGDGSLLTNVTGTDSTKLLKGGDTMTGHLLVSPSSVAILAMGAHDFALTVATSAVPGNYSFSVTTAGLVGVQVLAPTAPLEVNSKVLVSNVAGGDAGLTLRGNVGDDYVQWADNNFSAFGNANLGALGFSSAAGFTRPFTFRMLGSKSGSGGTEVFRINVDANDISSGNSWRFGLGTTNPQEKFHIAANMLVSTAAVSPILSISTTTGLVGFGTTAPAHKVQVNGGLLATSSITAQGGFFGDGSGITNISAGGLPLQMDISTIAARSDSGILIASQTYVNAKLIVGEIFDPITDGSDLYVKGTARIDQHAGLNSSLALFPSVGGNAYIVWDDAARVTKQGVLGMKSTEDDLVYWAGTNGIGGGTEALRLKRDGTVLLGAAGGAFLPSAHVNVVSNFAVSTQAASPILMVSTSTGYVGVSTGAPREGLHVASNLLVGPDRASALVFASTGATRVGIGTGFPRTLLEIGNGVVLANGSNTGDKNNPVNFALAGAGSRFLWLPSASAIRAGAVAGTEWDTVGLYSVAFGNLNSVTADYSVISGGSSNSVSDRFSVVAGGTNNDNRGFRSAIGGGNNNYMIGSDNSVVPGGAYNVVFSSYAFAGGYNNYLETSAIGTFVWGYDNNGAHGLSINKSAAHVTAPYAFLVDPDDTHHYSMGIRTMAPQATLDVNGDAQFGSGVTKSTFTTEGYWLPRSMTSAELSGNTPSKVGAVVFNPEKGDLCVSTSTLSGGWYKVGSGGATPCY